jgi:copper homeostasis protein
MFENRDYKIKNILKEACVESIQECLEMERRGASRVELCSDLAKSGTTPSFGVVKVAKESLKIPIFVIIRPRGGDFVYDENEMKIMLNDIKIFKEINVDGFVIGILNKENELDYEKNKTLIDEIKKGNNKASITFHMAFDEIPMDSKLSAIDKLVELGINRILTKGCKTKAEDGLENLRKFVEHSNQRIIIMIGGKVTSENYEKIVDFTGCSEVHGTKIV